MGLVLISREAAVDSGPMALKGEDEGRIVGVECGKTGGEFSVRLDMGVLEHKTVQYVISGAAIAKKPHIVLINFQAYFPLLNDTSPGWLGSILHADLCLSSSNTRERLGQSSSLV